MSVLLPDSNQDTLHLFRIISRLEFEIFVNLDQEYTAISYHCATLLVKFTLTLGS